MATRERAAGHRDAAAAFVRAVEQRSLPVDRLYLFGSTARDEASGLTSDVDFLVVVDDGHDAVTERLRDLAYDVMLEYGPVLEVHVLTRSEFDRLREADRPFLRRVLDEGERYV